MPSVKEKFHSTLFNWWAENKREFPWRKTTNPYHIMVSEFMLQQTQTTRVIPKYTLFLKKFPTMTELANADLRDVLSVWVGLGYNRRAKWLKEAAEAIVERGEFPQNYRELRGLKGIGEYTSRSILIFAFNHDLAAVDTNVRNVLSQFGFIDGGMTGREIQNIADTLVPKGKSRDYHNALMDYGSTHRKRKSSTTTSSYIGSKRYFRGKLVKLLVDGGKYSFTKIISELNCSSEELIFILDQLINEGIIKSKQNFYYI